MREGIPMASANMQKLSSPRKEKPNLINNLIPTAIRREIKEILILLSIHLLLIAMNIPTEKTGNLSIVHESTPWGDVQL